MAKEVNIDSLADKIADKLLAAKQQAAEAGNEVGEEFAKGVVQGVQKHSKEFKSEMTKMFEEFNRATNNFKSRKSISNSDWSRVLQLSQELLKSERYADNVREKLGDIAVTFKNIGKVSGLNNVLKELSKAENAIESVSWSEAGINYKKRTTTRKAKTNGDTKSGSDLLNDIMSSQEDAWEKRLEKERAEKLQAQREAEEANARAEMMVLQREGKAKGQAYSGDVYHGSGEQLTNVTFDPNVGNGLRRFGLGAYFTEELDKAAEYGENIVKKSVVLKNVFMLTEDMVSDLDDLYAAMGKIKPENVDYKTAIDELSSYLLDVNNIEPFTNRMKKIGYDSMFAQDGKSKELVVYDEQYWQNWTTSTAEQLKIEKQITDEKKKQSEYQQDKLAVYDEDSGKLVEFNADPSDVREIYKRTKTGQRRTNEYKQLEDFAKNTLGKDKLTLEESSAVSAALERIEKDGLSASDAMQELSGALNMLRAQSNSMPDDIIDDFGAESEQVAETVSQLKKLSSIDITRIFDSVDLKSFLQFFNIDSSHFSAFRQLFEELMQITSAMSNGVDVGNAFDVKMDEITSSIMRLGGHMENLDDSGYATMMQGFYKHMRNTKVQFNDQIKAEYTKDQWKSLYKTYKNSLTADITKGIPADSLYHEISGLWPSLFPDGVQNEKDQFKLIFEKLEEASRLRANGWKEIKGFTGGDRDGIQGSVDDMYNQMSAALYADSSADAINPEADATKNVEQNMNNAASAKGKFAQANKQVGSSANSSAEQLDAEADSMEALTASADKLPDGDVITKYFDGDNEDPSGAAIKKIRTIGDTIQTEMKRLQANEDGEWDVVGSAVTEKKIRSMQEYSRAYVQEAKKLSGIEANIRALGSEGMSEDLAVKVNTYTTALKDMDRAMKALQENPDDIVTSQQFDDAALRAQKTRTEIEGIFKESQKLQKLGTLVAVGTDDVSKVENLKAAMIEFASSALEGEVKINGFNKEGDQMYVTLTKAGGAVENITVALHDASGHLQAFTTGAAKATNEWEDFKTQAVAGAKNLIGMYVGFQEGVQAVRSGVNYVKEIDLAMTELKKVTDETDASYKQFLKDAGSTSAVIGSTISDFTEATATFARLGYSMEESSNMAETAIIYKNVADGLDSVEESSDSIISTMMAFGIEANDTMSIIDRFNAVGNNFAITSAGIGEALQRSASALYSAGNTIDESVALVTAANSVIQNPEQVGTALKTLALRLRGAKTELEEAGLETDNMAESTSTLQAKLNALTHGKVDIMLDADTFKSTTQILREMSDAWEGMTDIERASALELMGGKRQANILASVITNFETVEDVIETSMNSSGSAIAENEKWLDSIGGKTYQFTNALQTMWSNMLDSEAIKGFIDFGTDVIQFLDTGAGKVIALVAALKLMAKFKGFSIKGIAQGLGDTIKQVTTAHQTLQTLSKTAQIGSGYDLTNIDAYAQAVAGLTAKQQANLLASKGLNQEQIRYALTLNQVDDAAMREAMAHIHSASAKQQSADADQVLFQNKMAYAAQSLAIEAEATNSATKQAAADFLKANASKAATVEEMKELIMTSNLTAAEKAEALATVQQTVANKGLAVSIKAIYAANPVGFWITLASTIVSLIPIITELTDAFTKSAEEIKQEAEEITQAYTDAVDKVNNNLDSLGITNDAISIATLEKEFATLTAGVDRYGNNLSLTSDQYERYRDICEQIVGINPLLASGYDSATEAIGNNASVLSQLIELQKTQIRIAAEEYVKDENLKTLTQDAVNDYKDAAAEYVSTQNSVNSKIQSVLQDAYGEFVKNNPDYVNDSFDVGTNQARWILEQLGYGEDAWRLSQKYFNTDGMSGSFDSNSFFNDYLDEIKENRHLFGSAYADMLQNAFTDAEKEFKKAEEKLAEAKDGLIDTLLVAPVSSEDYDKLTSEGKNFLVDWIKNSDMFKISDGALTDEQVKSMKDAILNMMDILVSDAKNIEYNGEKFTAQELLAKVYNLDPSSVNYEYYKKQINEILTAFWDSLSDDQKKEYGFDKFEDFTISLGFDFVADEKSESDMIKGYSRAKQVSEDDARKYFNSLPAEVVQRLLKIDWDLVDSNNVDETIRNAKGNHPSIISSKTYSVLLESVESYNDILSQTSEIAADNTEVAQEYKDSLTNLGISQEELNECFDDANPLIVKNAKALNNLVKAASKNVAANVKLAKSNARLDYYQLVKQLGATLDGTKKLDAATRNSIYSTLEQIDAVEKALYQYQLLEDTLLGVNNAFDKFVEAQEIDSLNTYGDSYVEMAQTMYDALYKTGQVGTEAFWSSVEALIPTEVYQSLTDDADRIKAIYDYYNKNVLPSLRLEEDQLSIDYDAIEEFVKKGLNKGIFTGDVENFDLVEGMNLEKAAELMGMTEAQAYALFAELDKYNTAGNEHSFLSQLDDSLEGQINNITNEVENLNKQKLALLEDGGYEKNKEAIDEINLKLVQSENELNKLGKEAYSTWQQYTQNDAAIAALSEVEDKTALLTKEGATSLGLEWDEVKGQTVQQAIDNLLAKQLELEEPTVLTAQLAIDNIDSQIAALKQKLADSEKDPAVLGVEANADQTTIDAAKQKIQDQIQALEEDKVVISTTFGIELSEEEKAELQDELNAIEQFTINDKEFTVIANGISDTMDVLQKVQDYKIGDKSYTITTKYQTVGNNTARTPGSGGRYTKVDGTAHVNGSAYKNGSWGAPKTETALVGELGPEMLVRNGRWTTVGDNGAEFTQVKKGDIIFNHKQTEDLLSKGYVTGRGKLHGGAFASGTAYSGLWQPTSPDESLSNEPGREFSHAASDLDNAADSISDAADEFREVFDWIEVRLEEINDDISLKSAKLENKVGYKSQNKTIDQIIDLNQKLYDNLIAGANKYHAYANKLLSKVPAEYREAAQDGTIAIEEFVGEADEKTIEAIQEYREWVQKGDEAAQQAEETLTEIANLAKQAIDNIAADFDNQASIGDSRREQLEAFNEFLETDQGYESASVYQAMISANNENIKILRDQRDAMQAELNKRVESGEIEVYSDAWYEAVNEISAVDTEIINLQTDNENLQDSINQLHWDKFDDLLERIESVSDEADNLIDILSNEDMVDESGNWTDKGITALGLHAQRMEAAEVKAQKLADEISYLDQNWQKLGYTENEYLEKRDELKDQQYEAIQTYHDEKDAIVDLNKERVDAIKKGIEKEVEAYEELIKVKKEELDAEKDLYDFQKNVADKQKNIADLERKLAALSADNSASARAQRAKLEAELAEARADLQDTYYDRSISDQQEALDKELENFQEEKDKEMEGWDEYLENTNQVVADSLATVQANTEVVYNTLLAMGEEYSLSITESLTSPWQEGENAIQSFSEKFGVSMSATVDELTKLELDFKETMLEIEQAGVDAVDTVAENAKRYTEAEYQEPKEDEGSGGDKSDGEKSDDNSGSSTAGLVSSLSGYIQEGNTGEKVKKLQRALNELGYGNSGTSSVDGVFGSGTKSAVKAFQRAMGVSADGIVGPDTKAKFKAKGYALGTAELKKSGIINVDELGDELILRAQNGRLTYMEKGSGIVPADLTSNLMKWGELDPSMVLEQNRPQIGISPSVINNTTEIHLDASVGELIHVEKLDGNNPAEITKIVDKAWDKRMKELNAHIRRYTNR